MFLFSVLKAPQHGLLEIFASVIVSLLFNVFMECLLYGVGFSLFHQQFLLLFYS